MKYQILQKVYKRNYVKILIVAIIVSILSLSIGNLNAFNGGVDQTIRYSGKIYDSNFSLLSTGNYNMKIVIYEKPAKPVDPLELDPIIFEEIMDGTQTYGSPAVVCPKVNVINGKFDIGIGSCNVDTPLNTLLNASNLYIEVQLDINSDNTYEEIFSPRRKLRSVASAFNSLKLVSENTTTGNQSNLRIESNGTLRYTLDDGVSPTTKFIIEPSGEVGIGTLAPGYTLDVLGSANVTGAFSVTGSSTLEGLSVLDGADISKSLATGVSKGLTIANRGADNSTTGVGTSILFETAGTTYSGRSAIRSIGVGTEGQNTKLGLYTSADGTENNLTERLTILSNGNVGINTVNPGYALQVGNTADGTEARANAWNTLSDISVKRDITQIDQALDKINQLKGYYYYWRSDFKDQSRQVGFVSQEIERVLPEVVSRGDDGLLSLDYSKLTPLLLESVKELDAKVQSIQLTSDLLRNSFSQENLNIKGLTADGNILIKGDLTVLGKINHTTSPTEEIYNRDVNVSGDILATDKLISVDSSLGAVSLNLIQDNKLSGKEIIIKKVDNSLNKVIINNSSGLIDGTNSIELESQYQFIRIIYDGKNWNIVGKDK